MAPAAAHLWTVTTTSTTLSDHDILTFQKGPRNEPSNAACSPGKFWLLPEEARAELRRHWCDIALALGVPPANGNSLPPPETNVPVPGMMGPDDPMAEVLENEEKNEERTETRPKRSSATEEPPIAPNPLLCRWGHAFTQSTFQNWWKKWRGRGPGTAPEKQELARISKMSPCEPTPTSPVLSTWLESMGGPDRLTPTEAKQWLDVWINLEEATSAATRHSAGDTVSRPRLHRAVIAGRAVKGSKGAEGHIILPSGETLTQKELIGAALVATRQDLWFSRDKRNPEATEWLTAYARQRTHLLPDEIHATWEFLRGCVLAASGSAPGLDGVPYEAYQLYPQLMAAILGQALYSLHREDRPDPFGRQQSSLNPLIGNAIDLLVWIGKKPGDRRVGQQRPLQLPTCARRLMGSATASLIAPAIEPSLTKAQAAIAGGSCQQNIRAAFQHLAQPCQESTPPYRLRKNEWACRTLFGDSTELVLQLRRIRQRRSHHDIRTSPACLLLDQAKAFEVMSHEWLRQVLMAWNLPEWAFQAFVVLVEGRRLCDKYRPGWLSNVLRRGAGMGGPLSPLTWNATRCHT